VRFGVPHSCVCVSAGLHSLAMLPFVSCACPFIIYLSSSHAQIKTDLDLPPDPPRFLTSPLPCLLVLSSNIIHDSVHASLLLYHLGRTSFPLAHLRYMQRHRRVQFLVPRMLSLVLSPLAHSENGPSTHTTRTPPSASSSFPSPHSHQPTHYTQSTITALTHIPSLPPSPPRTATAPRNKTNATPRPPYRPPALGL
jgi:hypothetical protein